MLDAGAGCICVLDLNINVLILEAASYCDVADGLRFDLSPSHAYANLHIELCFHPALFASMDAHVRHIHDNVLVLVFIYSSSSLTRPLGRHSRHYNNHLPSCVSSLKTN